VNLAELIHNQASDRNGNVPPADVSGGPWTNLYGPVAINCSMSNASGQCLVTVSRSDISVKSVYVIPAQ
jgi:hypothetical protein